MVQIQNPKEMSMCKTTLLIMLLIFLLKNYSSHNLEPGKQDCDYADYMDYEEDSDELLDNESHMLKKRLSKLKILVSVTKIIIIDDLNDIESDDPDLKNKEHILFKN